MRKWLALVALGGTTAAGLAVRWYRKGRRDRAVKRIVLDFMKALEKNDLQAIMNETTLAKDHWTDLYAGSVSGRPFSFWMQVRVGDGRVERPGASRHYRLSWGETFIEVLASPVGRDGEPTAFARIHGLLAKHHRRLSEIRPS